ncbi:MAG: HAD family phosphatase [Actinomycetota bacterium]|nr:HAD family phosphatase [Actinomycetota bacterium]
MSAIEVLITDFGGVLTSPLGDAFASFQEEAGVPRHALREALAAVAAREGTHPLFELECGRITEPAFMAKLEDELRVRFGRDIAMHDFSERFWARLEPNERMLALLRELRDEGLRLALLTNNVREWEPRWRPMLPVDELFEVVVDSAFVGMRKPDPGIYELTLARLSVRAERCLFVDDLEVNCAAATGLGMVAVHFRDSQQAIGEVRAAVAGDAGVTRS